MKRIIEIDGREYRRMDGRDAVAVKAVIPCYTDGSEYLQLVLTDPADKKMMPEQKFRPGDLLIITKIGGNE